MTKRLRAQRELHRVPVPGLGAVSVLAVTDPTALPDRPVVVCCFPGGGMNHRYFALGGRYDMAEHLAAAGIVVLAFDHPGVGDSDAPDDPWTLTPELVADLDAAAVRAALDRFVPAEPGAVVGMGHSMGAMLVVYQQARHRLYDGVALLGYSGRGLPEVLTPDELAGAAPIAQLARRRFGVPLPVGETAHSELLVGPALAPDAAGALDRARAAMLTCCGLTSMIPGSHADQIASLDVPVFLGVAEHDITGPPHDIPRHFTGARDVTLHVLPGAFHNAAVAPRRAEQWDRLADWLRAL